MAELHHVCDACILGRVFGVKSFEPDLLPHLCIYGQALGSIAVSRSGMADFTQSSGGLLLLLMGIVATVAATVLVTRTSIRILEEAIGDVE